MCLGERPLRKRMGKTCFEFAKMHVQDTESMYDETDVSFELRAQGSAHTLVNTNQTWKYGGGSTRLETHFSTARTGRLRSGLDLREWWQQRQSIKQAFKSLQPETGATTDPQQQPESGALSQWLKTISDFVCICYHKQVAECSGLL